MRGSCAARQRAWARGAAGEAGEERRADARAGRRAPGLRRCSGCGQRGARRTPPPRCRCWGCPAGLRGRGRNQGARLGKLHHDCATPHSTQPAPRPSAGSRGRRLRPPKTLKARTRHRAVAAATACCCLGALRLCDPALAGGVVHKLPTAAAAAAAAPGGPGSRSSVWQLPGRGRLRHRHLRRPEGRPGWQQRRLRQCGRVVVGVGVWQATAMPAGRAARTPGSRAAKAAGPVWLGCKAGVMAAGGAPHHRVLLLLWRHVLAAVVTLLRACHCWRRATAAAHCEGGT